MTLRRRVLYFSGRYSRSHVWDGTEWGLFSSCRCRCGKFAWWEAKPAPGELPPKPPRGWPVSKRCANALANVGKGGWRA